MTSSYKITTHNIPLKKLEGNKEYRTYDNVAYIGDKGNEQPQHTPTPNHYHDDGERNADDFGDEESTGCSLWVESIQKKLSSAIESNAGVLWIIFYIVLVLAYFAYFSYAMYYRFGDEGSWRLMIVTVLCSAGLFFKLSFRYIESRRCHHEDDDVSSWKQCQTIVYKFMTKIKFAVVLPAAILLGIAAYVVVDIAIDRPRNLISLGGMAFFILSLYIFSFNPSKVKWRPVTWGIILQLVFALLILRTSWGRDAFAWLGDRVTEFLAYTDEGSKFVFGDKYEDHYFAFKVLPVVVFFSTFVAVMYYLGVMQAIIQQLGRFLSFCLGTSPVESINAAANIFIGQTEAPLLIRPFMKDMTKSEIHAVMTGGFATIAGAVMAAYILYKVPANHLLSASVMSAPAALAVSKLFYPETEKTKHAGGDVYNMARGTERNFIEAASNGASMSIKLVANIAVNLIAFVAFLDFINATLVWFGDRVGYDKLTFQLICSYLFWPLAFLMGVDQEDCRVVGQLVGTKTFLNEFVAYRDLSVFINNRIVFNNYLANASSNGSEHLTGGWMYKGDDIYLNDTGEVLPQGVISVRSVVIATYALCGFANLSSMGIQLGALGAMAPTRKGDMANIVFRAMLAGNVACFMTACIAGLFYDGS